MALYDFGRRVWVKDLRVVGTVEEAGYGFGPGSARRAWYVVNVPGMQGMSYMCGSSNLRAADWGCDGCDGWFAGRPYATGPDGEYPNGLQFCFVCAGPPAQRLYDKQVRLQEEELC